MNEHEDETEPNDPEALTDIKWVGPATAEVLADAPFDAVGITNKTVSYEMLIEAGVNAGIATKIRREHSLSWSFESSDDTLERRSTNVRGLQDGEREWVAASGGDWEDAEPETTETTDGDWTPTGKATTDGSGAAEAAEAAWRERSKPDPITDVESIDESIAETLAEGGITSVRSLATADPEHVADSLELDEERVTRWWNAARDIA